ncbi:MAG: glycosyltransferase family 39 protein [Myxococcales bacterium]
MGQAPYYFEREPPPPSAIYTHHPMALHGHLVASFALFGPHEWAARIIPFAYSLGALIFLVVLVRRFWGARTACFVGSAYALIPLNWIFGNMVAHQQGCIFFSLWMVYAYLRWLENGRSADAAMCMLALTLAAQFDWPGYYIAFAIAVHCVILGARGRAGPHWAWFLVLFSGVTLANLVAFFSWIYVARSGLQEMIDAFRFRNRMPAFGFYATLLAERVTTLYGPIMLPAAIGAGAALRAARRRGLEPRAILPSAFGFAGLVNIAAFPDAAALHSYWMYYWTPAIAVAAGIGLQSISSRRDQRSAATIFLAFVALQGGFAWHEWKVQLDHGHAADCEECYFQRYERLWFGALGAHFDSAKTRYALHRSIRDPRIELTYYLDAPHRTIQRVNRVTKDEVLLLDFDNIDDKDRVIVDSFVRKHPTLVWNDRFYAIDRSKRNAQCTHFDSVPDDLGLIRWWLTTQTSDLPLRWERRGSP